MTKTNLNPNSSNFSNIKAMFEGLTTKKTSEKAFEGLQSVTNTTEPKAQLPSPKATSTEGKKRPPAVPEKTAKTKKEYDRLKQKHEANLLSKSVAPELQKPVLPRATSTEGKKIPPSVPEKTGETKQKYKELKQKHEANLLSKSVAPERQKPPVPPRTRTKNKFLQDKLDEVARTGKLDCKGITDESLIHSALRKIRKAGLPIRTLDLSECHLTRFPTLLLEKDFNHI